MVKQSIFLRVKSVKIGYDATHYSYLKGVEDADWNDSDPFVPMEIPASFKVTVFQHIKPIQYELTLTCRDYTSIRAALYVQNVNGSPSKPAINPTTGERTAIVYLYITMTDQAGTDHTFKFTNARVRTVSLNKEELKESNWKVDFWAEFIEEV